jgi:hypothetical protein
MSRSLVGTSLEGLYHKADAEALPRCCECGNNILTLNGMIAQAFGLSRETIDRDGGEVSRGVRADARYCSPKCRQRAYRKRVMANRSNNGRKRHAAKVRDASHVRNRGEAVT